MVIDMTIRRNYKDTVFRQLFGSEEHKQNALELYNAINGTSYSDLDALELTTLDDAIYMGHKNDVSFLIGDELSLWEHQSTFNPNMPLRGLLYFSKLYSRYVDKAQKSVYGSSGIPLPTPRFIVFYAGAQRRPEREVLKLSDSFSSGPGDLEVTVTILNINEGMNATIMTSCEALRGYAQLVAKARDNRKAVGWTMAIDEAIEACISEGVLADYLRHHRAEVLSMFLTEWDEEKEMAKLANQYRMEALEEGRAEGLAEGRAEGLAEGRKSVQNETLLKVGELVKTGKLRIDDAASVFEFTEEEIRSVM